MSGQTVQAPRAMAPGQACRNNLQRFGLKSDTGRSNEIHSKRPHLPFTKKPVPEGRSVRKADTTPNQRKRGLVEAAEHIDTYRVLEPSNSGARSNHEQEQEPSQRGKRLNKIPAGGLSGWIMRLPMWLEKRQGKKGADSSTRCQWACRVRTLEPISNFGLEWVSCIAFLPIPEG